MLTLWDPMNCSTPGFPAFPYLPVFAQIHVHSVSDAYPTISSSIILFSSCLPSFPSSGSYAMSQLFTSGDQNTGASISASILPTNSHSLFLLGLAGLISLHSKRLSRVPCNATTWKLQVLYFAYIDGWTFKIIKFLLKVCWYLKAVLS